MPNIKNIYQQYNAKIHDPFRFTKEKDSYYLKGDKITNQPGIYIWTIASNKEQFPGKDFPNYIGITEKSFKIRNDSHLKKQKSGEYSIFNVKSAKNGDLKLEWRGEAGRVMDDVPKKQHEFDLAPFKKDENKEKYQNLAHDYIDEIKLFCLVFDRVLLKQEMELWEHKIGLELRNSGYGELLHSTLDTSKLNKLKIKKASYFKNVKVKEDCSIIISPQNIRKNILGLESYYEIHPPTRNYS